MEEAQIWEQSAFPAGIPKISKDLQLRSHWECVLWQWQAESHPSSHCQLQPSWHTQDVTDQPFPVANGRFFLVQPRCMVRNPLLGASGFPVADSWALIAWILPVHVVVVISSKIFRPILKATVNPTSKPRFNPGNRQSLWQAPAGDNTWPMGTALYHSTSHRTVWFKLQSECCYWLL